MHPQQTGDLPCQRPGLVTSRRRPRPRGRPAGRLYMSSRHAADGRSGLRHRGGAQAIPAHPESMRR